MKSGASDYLIKPLSTQNLGSLLVEIIQKHKDKREGAEIIAYEKSKKPFRIFEIYLLQKDSGLILYHIQLKDNRLIDEEIVGGMLQGIRF